MTFGLRNNEKLFAGNIKAMMVVRSNANDNQSNFKD